MSDKFLDWVGRTPFVEIKIANISQENILIEVDSKFVEDNGNGIFSSVKTSKCILNSDNDKELLTIIKQLYDISKKGISNDLG